MPEQYLWTIFRAQIEALHAMHYGTVIKNDTDLSQVCITAPGWKVVINPDIKLPNVVLGDAQSDCYGADKTPKLIDFGQAFEEGPGKCDSLDTKHPVGTENLWPPEIAWPLIRGWENNAIGLHSEIYTVGLNMLSLILGEYKESVRPDTIDARDTDEYEEKYWLPRDFDRTYTHFLIKIVLKCLRMMCEERPTLIDLLYKTRRGLEQWEKAHGSADGEDVPAFMRFDVLKEEEFPIGAKDPDKWDWRKERKAEDPEPVRHELVDPALTDLSSGPAPSKKAKSVSRKSSKTLVGSSPARGVLAKLFQKKGEKMFRDDCDENEEGFELRSLKNKKEHKKGIEWRAVEAGNGR
ncbi:uncharacterized protein M421DRAFT_177857 [Didymella exigua CBS 183.55]|uniref:Protein kinase domain-containing protein n=1 Tax=Didymella exigua CBS 183.55 TaxID=1150837 RepID=A0A6A5RK75_9PLEO|nr:uncharacterized protein M421DRAFT_177857 [Didymella exigua CBS 183.55]KAF1927364.1 hypothetical protein M421DRAFT_177857 [Didymella exigua CBS 183.55]